MGDVTLSLNPFSPQEWKMLIVIVLVTVVATNFIKAGWRFAPKLPGEHRAWLNLIAVVVGTAFGYALWPKGTDIPWWVGGTIAGFASPIGFKVFNAVVLNRLPQKSRARRILKSDRRKVDGLPPEGTPERRR